MVRWIVFVLVALGFGRSFSQNDTVKIGLTTYLIVPAGQHINIDSLLAIEPNIELNPNFYKTRYNETDLLYKITDNKGNGYDSLYGTRNMRPILHGVAYRGGGNNYYHTVAKRDNHNPIPPDGISNLCEEGFSRGIYLYRENFEFSPLGDTCNCIDNSYNQFKYEQKDYYDSSHVYDMLQSTYESAMSPEIGPIYLHCWNGWHASGFVAAVMLKQFCGFSSWDAVNYWDLGTDGANTSPRYQTQRDRIRNFEPYPEFMISDSLKACLCPPLPEHIDSSQLHIEIEHLVVVPEAIPVGFHIVLYNVEFAPNTTSFSNIAQNPDIINLKKALDLDTNLVVEIGGYTDNSGSVEKNITISRQRAEFVYNHLIQAGYNPARISFHGYGPANPIYSNSTKSSREGNRRIEIKVISKTGHRSDRLVDEKGSNVQTVTTAQPNRLLSYYLANKTEEGLGNVFIIDSLVFASSSFQLPTTGKGIDNLNALVAYLNDNKLVGVTINGYTDASGIEDNNKILSENRAKVVYDYLIQQGISAERLVYNGYGSKNPIATNAYLWGRDQNRRIEVEFRIR